MNLLYIGGVRSESFKKQCSTIRDYALILPVGLSQAVLRLISKCLQRNEYEVRHNLLFGCLALVVVVAAAVV